MFSATRCGQMFRGIKRMRAQFLDPASTHARDMAVGQSGWSGDLAWLVCRKKRFRQLTFLVLFGSVGECCIFIPAYTYKLYNVNEYKIMRS